MLFVVGELLLVLAIPFMIIEGYHTLLDSRAGRFVEELTREDPGWRALVDSTEVVGIAEVDQGTVTGVTLLINHVEVRSAGTAVLVPGTLLVDDVPLSGRAPADAVQAVGAALDLAISRVEILDDAGWDDVLGQETWVVESPDPVLDEAGNPLFEVGPVNVGADNVAAFVGRPAPGASPVSVLPRRELFWNAVIGSPPSAAAAIAEDLRAIDATTSQVLNLPAQQLEPQTILDEAGAEALVREIVAFPAGPAPGDRLRVRVLDRTGAANLEGIAAALAARGIEVIEIGNAFVFDDGGTEVIAPMDLSSADGALPDRVNQLIVAVGLDAATLDPEAPDDVVIVVVGGDFDLANVS